MFFEFMSNILVCRSDTTSKYQNADSTMIKPKTAGIPENFVLALMDIAVVLGLAVASAGPGTVIAADFEFVVGRLAGSFAGSVATFWFVGNSFTCVRV